MSVLIYPFQKTRQIYLSGLIFLLYLPMKEKDLYQLIENAIIKWSNDGTKTAGTLTREILEIIENNNDGS